MIDGWFIHAHAIVSADDRIAAADGTVPPALRVEADWVRFQAALDAAAVTVLGRRGHDANPNDRRRNRLVLSSSARGIERGEDAWWWNPAATPLAEALARAAPAGGTVAVVGGRRVFDLFLSIGFDRFDLARAGDVSLPGGIPIFSAVAAGSSANAVLAAHGLVAGPTQILDAEANVSLVVWRRQAIPGKVDPTFPSGIA
jgi:dihydrofolate reductase